MMNHLLSWRVSLYRGAKFKNVYDKESSQSTRVKTKRPIYATAKVILFQHDTDLHSIYIRCHLNKKYIKTNIENWIQDLLNFLSHWTTFGLQIRKALIGRVK